MECMMSLPGPDGSHEFSSFGPIGLEKNDTRTERLTAITILGWLLMIDDERTLDRTVNSSVSYVWNDGFAFKDEENIKHTSCRSKGGRIPTYFDIAHRVIRSNKQQCIGHRNICHDGSGRQRKQILSAWDLMLRDPSFWPLDRTVKSSVSYECNDRFAVQDKVKIQHTSCSSKGEWIPEIYLCQSWSYLSVHERTLDRIVNSIVSYEWNDGFAFKDEENIKHTLFSSKGERIPKKYDWLCIRVSVCLSVDERTLDWAVNSSVSYKWNDGFAFKDEENIKHTSCSSKGEWIPEIYDCLYIFDAVDRSNKQQCIGHRNICHDGSGRQRKQVLCPSVPAWTNASFWSLDRTVNSSVSYECNDGFAFKDKEKIKHFSCSSKGEWIPEIYFCLSECNDDKLRSRVGHL